jgi:hypothetical protein
MQISLSPEMLKSIDSQVQEARGRGVILDIYRVAETIRVKHIDDNIALEDIIEKIVLIAGSNFPVEFNLPYFADEESMEGVDGTPVEFLIINKNSIH